MLTAFSYYDPDEEDRIQCGIKNTEFFAKEKKIVAEFAKYHTGKWKELCPACKSKNVWPVFKKEGVTYERCEVCGSIFAAVTNLDVEEYFSQPILNNIRFSDEYQKKAEESRGQRWDDVLDWISFRAFRYLQRNEGLTVLDCGDRWHGLVERIKATTLCGKYYADESIENIKYGEVEIVIALNYLERFTNPYEFFCRIAELLSSDGLFIFSIKAGNGFDILKLRENHPGLLPYEHNFLPSHSGIECLLNRAEFELLEYTTPGTFDLNYVAGNADKLDANDYFIRYFLENATPSTKAEFQRFLQRSGMSSYAQLIARKRRKR